MPTRSCSGQTGSRSTATRSTWAAAPPSTLSLLSRTCWTRWDTRPTAHHSDPSPPCHLSLASSQFLRSQRKLSPEARAIGLATPSSPRGINSFFRYLGRRKNNLSHVGVVSRPRDQPLYLLSDQLWQRAMAHLCEATRGGCLWPTRTAVMRPSSGFFAVLVALQSCRNVSLFGFTSDPCLPFHYYGKRPAKCAEKTRSGAKMAVPKENDEHVHWFDREHEIYFEWERRGWLRVFS